MSSIEAFDFSFFCFRIAVIFCLMNVSKHCLITGHSLCSAFNHNSAFIRKY